MRVMGEAKWMKGKWELIGPDRKIEQDSEEDQWKVPKKQQKKDRRRNKAARGRNTPGSACLQSLAGVGGRKHR